MNSLSQQLLFQPVPGDSEINEGGLSLQFWLVRVSQFSVKDEMKIPVEFTFFAFNLGTSFRAEVLQNTP